MKREVSDRQKDIVRYMAKKWRYLSWQEILEDNAIIFSLAVAMGDAKFMERLKELLKP
jgi:hypothetical protein